MLHSGSRGTGNLIGHYFIEAARKALEKRVLGYHVPDQDLAFFVEGEPMFDDYIEAGRWAQDYARMNREAMMERTLQAMREHLPKFKLGNHAVNCHHNYVEKERHFDADVWVTRKGAVRAGLDELGIIPGSMGAKSFIVRGKGNADSFCSCSHGAGRAMSRTEAKQRFTLKDHREATEGVECRKDAGRDRRNADGLQGHRRRDRGPVRPDRGGAHAEAGGVRERVRNDERPDPGLGPGGGWRKLPPSFRLSPSAGTPKCARRNS